MFEWLERWCPRPRLARAISRLQGGRIAINASGAWQAGSESNAPHGIWSPCRQPWNMPACKMVGADGVEPPQTVPTRLQRASLANGMHPRIAPASVPRCRQPGRSLRVRQRWRRQRPRHWPLLLVLCLRQSPLVLSVSASSPCRNQDWPTEGHRDALWWTRRESNPRPERTYFNVSMPCLTPSRALHSHVRAGDQTSGASVTPWRCVGCGACKPLPASTRCSPSAIRRQTVALLPSVG